MKLKGSATIEAAMIMPVIIVFFASFIWMIDVFRIHSRIGTVIADAGKSMSAYSYAYNTILTGHEESELINLVASIGWSETYLRSCIMECPESKKIKMLSTANCSINKEGAISIIVSYYVEPYISVPGFNGFRLTNAFFCKNYTGCLKQEQASDDEVVFVTKNSQVYHTDEKCREITRTVSTVLYSEIGKKRNMVRGKYYPCSKCGKEKPGNVVFITPQGDKYHISEKCSDLVITVYSIPRSEIGERRKCYYCQ